MLVAVLGLAGAGCGGTRLNGHGVLFVRRDPESESTGIGPVYVWRPGSRSTSKVSQSTDLKSWVQWSPDGKQISFVAVKGYLGDSPEIGDSGDIWVADVKDVAKAKDVTPLTQSCCPHPLPPNWTCECGGGPGYRNDGDFAPSWSPDGRQIAYDHEGSNFTNTLRILTLETGRSRSLHVYGFVSTWGPRGIAYSSGRSIRLLNPETDQWKPFASAPGDVKGLAWSRSGGLAALVNRRLVVVYSASGRPIRRFRAPQPTCANAITWSPDGKHLLITAGYDRHSTYWHVYEVDPAGRHWQLTPIRPSDCATSWR